MLERFFKLKEHSTNVRTEVIAGVTTFFTMAYILFVNPTLLSAGAAIVGENGDKVFNGVFFATCLASFIGTALMAFLAKIPFAQAPGMGLNAFFAFTVMAYYGYSYAEALAIVFVSGLVFIVISITGLRTMIVRCIPQSIKIAISAGIGLFLAFLGLQSAGLVGGDPDTLVALANFSGISNPETRGAVMAAVLSLIGLLIIGILSARKVKGAILIGILAATVIGIPMGVTALPEHAGQYLAGIPQQFGSQLADFAEVSLFAFGRGLSSLFSGGNLAQNLLVLIGVVLSFSIVDMFDTIGTLLGTARQAGLMKEDGTMERMNEAFLSDAIATTSGAMLGTSTVTTFVESAAGVGEGGRTGLTSAVTALLFLAATVLAPFVGIVPAAATAPALIFVGCLMITGIRELDWSDMSEALPAFLTIAMMPFSYSIANGIAFGLISYTVIKLGSGKARDIHPLCAGLAVLFLLRYFTMG